MSALPDVSVVIIGRNEGERLVRCIETVQQTRYLGRVAEVIYVDSNSTDGSRERAAALGVRVIAVRPERPTAAIGRNAGWRAARTPLVLFLDGDTLLDPDFIAAAVNTIQRPGVAVVFGNRREIRPRESAYNRVLDLDWVSPPGPAEYCGGDALMWRSVLEEVAGYDESLIAGEEPDMCRRMRRLGHTILHIDVPMTGHDLAMTRWSQYWRRAVRTGYAYAEVSARYRRTEIPLWTPESKGNLLRGSVLIAVTIGGVALALAFWSVWPLIVLAAFWLLLVVRTERRIRWKSEDRVARWLYALHSHLQQIPILIGQLGYRRDRRSSRKRPLIEYKEAQ
jgi:glycosyltransferase involved in cell wall biosynthesis